MTLLKVVTFFGETTAFACDGKCSKAWGINSRPRDAQDDYLPDSALETAPENPGTYEGGEGKPQIPNERMNKWCIRECERSVLARIGEPYKIKDFEGANHG